MEGSGFFGSTKRKLDLPLEFVYDCHHLNKMNYSIPRPNISSTRAHIENPSMMKMWCLTLLVCWSYSVLNLSDIFLVFLIRPRKSVKRCMPSQDIHVRPKWEEYTWHIWANLHRRTSIPTTTNLHIVGFMEMT